MAFRLQCEDQSRYGDWTTTLRISSDLPILICSPTVELKLWTQR